MDLVEALQKEPQNEGGQTPRGLLPICIGPPSGIKTDSHVCQRTRSPDRLLSGEERHREEDPLTQEVPKRKSSGSGKNFI